MEYNILGLIASSVVIVIFFMRALTKEKKS